MKKKNNYYKFTNKQLHWVNLQKTAIGIDQKIHPPVMVINNTKKYTIANYFDVFEYNENRYFGPEYQSQTITSKWKNRV